MSPALKEVFSVGFDITTRVLQDQIQELTDRNVRLERKLKGV